MLLPNSTHILIKKSVEDIQMFPGDFDSDGNLRSYRWWFGAAPKVSHNGNFVHNRCVVLTGGEGILHHALVANSEKTQL